MDADRELQLEIDAFMTPAIRRARILLVAMGVLYLIGGVYNYLHADETRARVEGAAAKLRELGVDLDPDVQAKVEAARRTVSAITWAAGIVALVGLAHFVLAAWAGRRPLAAFYVALGLFGLRVLTLALALGPLSLLSVENAIAGIILVFGLVAAQKVERLRASRALGIDAAPTL
jgi:hypothetical protein